MINDLSQATSEVVERSTPVCIIGAGTAGIFLARQLRHDNVGVLLLESGDSLARKPVELGHYCEQQGIPYRGADQGRSFGLGGTSVLWGGQMIPLTVSDMAARSAVAIPAWPLSHDQVAAYFPRVEAALGLLPVATPQEEQRTLARHFSALGQIHPDFELRLSQWIPFQTRNFAKAFATDLQGDADLEVWTNASVVSLDQAADNPGRIAAVQARSPKGRHLVVHPQVVVICAGALESTRLMLAFDEAAQGLITKAGAPLGHYFADHLSVTCGRFQCHDWRRYNLATAPLFQRGVMRTPRLEITSQVQDQLALTSAFAHFTFVTHGDTGFDMVRDVLRRRQGEDRSLAIDPLKLGTAVGDVSAMALWRSLHQRLYIPRQAELLLQVDIEQLPNWDSHLRLAEERDDLGRRRLIVAWQITPEDRRVIRTVAERAIAAWGQSDLSRVATLHPGLPEDLDNFESLYDVYHPTGMLRMGSSPANSVVDPDLRVWPLENTYISSTGVFPSAGSANPGLTHLALTCRLGDHLVKTLSSRDQLSSPSVWAATPTALGVGAGQSHKKSPLA